MVALEARGFARSSAESWRGLFLIAGNVGRGNQFKLGDLRYDVGPGLLLPDANWPIRWILAIS